MFVFKKETLLNITGIILVILTLADIMTTTNISSIFWLSNHAPFIMGLAILTRNSFLLLAEISLVFIGEIIWCVDYLSALIFNFHPFGTTEYMFIDVVPTGQFVSSLSHFGILPLGIIAFLLLNKKAKWAWVGSAFHAGILIPLIIYFVPDYGNINCFFESCISSLPTPTYYFFFVSVLIYFVLFVIPVSILLNKVIDIDSAK